MSTILEAYLENEVALKRYLRRFIHSREAADDLAQEAFLRAFAAETGRVIEAPKAFLFKVAKNLALNELARSINFQWTWFSDLYKNALLVTPQYFAQPRVASFNTSDITVAKKIGFENGTNAQVYLSIQNIANAQAPIVTGSTANPGVGLPVPAGEDVMGRYYTIGIRGNL